MHNFGTQFQNFWFLLQELSVHFEGIKCYTLAQRMEGGSYLLSCDPLSSNPLEVTYLYPNLESAIRGQFEVRKNGIWAMTEGKYGKVQHQPAVKMGFMPLPLLQEDAQNKQASFSILRLTLVKP